MKLNEIAGIVVVGFSRYDNDQNYMEAEDDFHWAAGTAQQVFENIIRLQMEDVTSSPDAEDELESVSAALGCKAKPEAIEKKLRGTGDLQKLIKLLRKAGYALIVPGSVN